MITLHGVSSFHLFLIMFKYYGIRTATPIALVIVITALFGYEINWFVFGILYLGITTVLTLAWFVFYWILRLGPKT